MEPVVSELAFNRPVACLPMPSPLWHGMLLRHREGVDLADDRAPAVIDWVSSLLQGAARAPLACPRCGSVAPVAETLTHLFAAHDAGYAEAADTLEGADPDLYALAIHYLASKARNPTPRL